MPTIPLLDKVSALASKFDAWLCDIWGVMHNGVDAFPAAAEACDCFRSAGGTVLLVSNAPRPAHSVETQLGRYGVPKRAFDAIVSSGDVARAHITDRGFRGLHHLGPERDKPIFEGLDISFVEPADAEVIVCSGLNDDDTETPEDYRERLSHMRGLGLTMICANPDLMVERGARLVYCAGALAELYAELGGTVVYTGKPHAPIYELALRRLAELRGAPVSRDRVLAIGDGLKTDMAGAAAAGLDSLYIASGLHLGDHAGAIDGQVVSSLFAGADVLPVAAQARLTW